MDVNVVGRLKKRKGEIMPANKPYPGENPRAAARRIARNRQGQVAPAGVVPRNRMRPPVAGNTPPVDPSLKSDLVGGGYENPLTWSDSNEVVPPDAGRMRANQPTPRRRRRNPGYNMTRNIGKPPKSGY